MVERDNLDAMKSSMFCLGLASYWPSRRARVRRAAATLALVALAWPALGPLPWVAEIGASRADVDGHHAGAGVDYAIVDHHKHRDASEIPNSPLHPIDHDCFACQVFAQLLRCAPLATAVPAIPIAPTCPLPPQFAAVRPFSAPATVLPPVRAPPFREA